MGSAEAYMILGNWALFHAQPAWIHLLNEDVILKKTLLDNAEAVPEVRGT